MHASNKFNKQKLSSTYFGYNHVQCEKYAKSVHFGSFQKSYPFATLARGTRTCTYCNFVQVKSDYAIL